MASFRCSRARAYTYRAGVEEPLLGGEARRELCNPLAGAGQAALRVVVPAGHVHGEELVVQVPAGYGAASGRLLGVSLPRLAPGDELEFVLPPPDAAEAGELVVVRTHAAVPWRFSCI